MKFIDEVSFTVESGSGGPGCVSFRREKFLPRGGPDGGDGGAGGDIVFRVNPRLNTLVDLYHRRKLKAANGHPGEAQNCAGKDGEDLVIEVPPGTVIRTETGKVADLEEGELVFLKGGRGGKGNTFFTNSVNQAPTYAQPGEPGQAAQLFLELKLIADVGLLGFPNVGKSTFISRISAAKPKIADYPFTTLTPNLGVVKYGDNDSFVVADIPGLIPGAHKGVGLGIQFLRHVERTRVLVHLIDASGMSGRDPWEDYLAINTELEMYDREFKSSEEAVADDFVPLHRRPQIVVLNKIDAADPVGLEDTKLQFLKNGVQVHALSAVTGQGINKAIELMGRKVFGE